MYLLQPCQLLISSYRIHPRRTMCQNIPWQLLLASSITLTHNSHFAPPFFFAPDCELQRIGHRCCGVQHGWCVFLFIRQSSQEFRPKMTFQQMTLNGFNKFTHDAARNTCLALINMDSKSGFTCVIQVANTWA